MSEQEIRKSICELLAEEQPVKYILKKTSEEKVEYAVAYNRVDDKVKLVAGPVKGMLGKVEITIPSDKNVGSVHTHVRIFPHELLELSVEDIRKTLEAPEKWFCVAMDRQVKCADFVDKKATLKQVGPLIKRYEVAGKTLDKFEQILKEEERKRGREIVGKELSELYEKIEGQYVEAQKAVVDKLKQLAREKKASVCEGVVKF